MCVFLLSLWLQVSLDKGDRKDRDLHEDLWFELSDETLCNWMMFVRPAQNHLEQNLVAYQYGHHVYTLHSGLACLGLWKVSGSSEAQ